MSLINEIDVAACLLLDKRVEYWMKLQADFKKVGIDVAPCLVGEGKLFPNEMYYRVDTPDLPPQYLTTNFYPSWINKSNAYNAFLSHRLMLEDAIKGGRKNLLIIEDDVQVEDDFLEVIENVSPFFKENKWDMIQFGAYHHNNTERVTDNILKTKASGGWHCCLINETIFKLLYSFLPIGPFDWISEQFIQPNFNCYSIYPSIVSQRSGLYSYVEGSNLEKPSRFAL